MSSSTGSSSTTAHPEDGRWPSSPASRSLRACDERRTPLPVRTPRLVGGPPPPPPLRPLLRRSPGDQPDDRSDPNRSRHRRSRREPPHRLRLRCLLHALRDPDRATRRHEEPPRDHPGRTRDLERADARVPTRVELRDALPRAHARRRRRSAALAGGLLLDRVLAPAARSRDGDGRLLGGLVPPQRPRVPPRRAP